MSRAITSISLRINEHLRKRQKKFIIMNYVICMTTSILWKTKVLELIYVMASGRDRLKC